MEFLKIFNTSGFVKTFEMIRKEIYKYPEDNFREYFIKR